MPSTKMHFRGPDDCKRQLMFAMRFTVCTCGDLREQDAMHPAIADGNSLPQPAGQLSLYARRAGSTAGSTPGTNSAPRRSVSPSSTCGSLDFKHSRHANVSCAGKKKTKSSRVPYRLVQCPRPDVHETVLVEISIIRQWRICVDRDWQPDNGNFPIHRQMLERRSRPLVSSAAGRSTWRDTRTSVATRAWCSIS
jgi:hypothetical protein